MRGAVLATLLVVVLGPSGSLAESATPGRVLVVAVADVPPFAIKGEDGTWTGLSIELWRLVADELDLRWEVRAVALPDIDGVLRNRSADVALGAIAVSAEGEEAHDYSLPYLTTGLGFAEPAKRGPSWRTMVRALVGSGVLSILAAIAAAIVLTGVLIAVIERRRNPEQFGGSLPRGIATGVWWAGVTMTTVGYGDATPKTVSGRSVALVWMFVGVAAVAMFTATITSVLTVGSLQGNVDSPSDLEHVRLAAIAGGPAAEYLRVHHVGFAAHPSTEEALQALADGDVDATLAPVPALRYLVSRRWQGVLRVSPIVVEPISYAIGLPDDSALRQPIDRALLRIIREDRWRSIEHEWLGHQ
jgi:ABC-type amino acid transport substrate-binding protein